jgi:Secretion system C-terminal sorting domain
MVFLALMIITFGKQALTIWLKSKSHNNLLNFQFKTCFMKNIFSGIVACLLCLAWTQDLAGQNCPGSSMTISLTNLTKVADVVEFDIEFSNSNAAIAIKTSGINGGVYLNVPSTVTGTLTVVDAPVAPAPTGLLTLSQPILGTSNRGLRVVQTATTEPTAPTAPTVSTKFVRLRFTRTAGAALPAIIVVTFQPTGGAAPSIVAYCSGLPNSTSYNVAASNLLVSAPLPIDLVEFRARAKGALNLIEWVTASEHNTAWHIVERSANGTENWSAIGKVAAAGSSSNVLDYQLEDKQPLEKSYYRLRSVDFDGQDERSSIVSVTRRSGIFGMTGLYPSPTSDLVNIQFEAMEEALVTLKVTDTNGRLVLEQQVSAIKGDNLTELNLGNLPVGTYAIQLISDDNASAQVMVVKQ